MASEAAHYLGVCYMQKEDPDYVAASKAFDRALKDKEYDLREESLANHGWCLYASAGEGEQRDAARLKRAIGIFQTLRKGISRKASFLDRAMFYSGEAAYGLGQAKKAIEFYDSCCRCPTPRIRHYAAMRSTPAVWPMRISNNSRKHSPRTSNC